jgi:hypothetical protein
LKYTIELRRLARVVSERESGYRNPAKIRLLQKSSARPIDGSFEDQIEAAHRGRLAAPGARRLEY